MLSRVKRKKRIVLFITPKPIRQLLILPFGLTVVRRWEYFKITIYLNLNDYRLIKLGIVKVARDFNINSKGFLNCSDSAQMIIGGSLNQAGTLWETNL